MKHDFSDEIVARYLPKDPQATCRSITFQVTDDCCLNCSYCYQVHKGHRFMSIETAKEIIDLLFRLYDENDEDMVINHHTYGIVLDFIGGEPFMNIDTISFATKYFIEECFRRDHVWLTNFRVSMSSNGLLYFEPKVQEYLHEYKNFVSLNITIDGPKEIHDTCRKDFKGEGSFDRSIKAWKHWNEQIEGSVPDTKVTIAPENLSQLESTFDFFLAQGCTTIYANPIFEHPWTIREASEYYHILIRLADKLLKVKGAESSLFFDFKGKPLPPEDTNNYCGGTSAMLAFDPEGKAYPCLRYMASSLSPDRAPLVIGDKHGIYNTPEYKAIYDDMKAVTRQSQSPQECLDCPVASGCAWCSAENYNEFGTYNKRSTNICWMHRAESLANVYYWNKYYKLHNIEKTFPLYLPRNIAEKIITNHEYNELYILSHPNI